MVGGKNGYGTGFPSDLSFFYTVCITKLCQQRVSLQGNHRLLPVGFRADCIEQFLSHYLLCYGRGKDTSYTDRFTGIHMLYLMIHYVGDFMKFQLKLRTEVILFCSLVMFNSMLIIRAAQRETYQDAFRIALLCYTGILWGWLLM